MGVLQQWTLRITEITGSNSKLKENGDTPTHSSCNVLKNVIASYCLSVYCHSRFKRILLHQMSAIKAIPEEHLLITMTVRVQLSFECIFFSYFAACQKDKVLKTVSLLYIWTFEKQYVEQKTTFLTSSTDLAKHCTVIVCRKVTDNRGNISLLCPLGWKRQKPKLTVICLAISLFTWDTILGKNSWHSSKTAQLLH